MAFSFIGRFTHRWFEQVMTTISPLQFDAQLLQIPQKYQV